MPGLYYWISEVDQAQLAFADETAKRLLHIVNDARFLDKIRNADYSGRRFRVDGNPAKYISASNTRILNQVLTGKEWGTVGDKISI